MYSLQKLKLLLLVSLFLSACGGGGGNNNPPAAAAPVNNPPAAVAPAIDSDITDHSFVTDHFSGSQNCALCHDGLQDAAGEDVSIIVDWQSTMMANSSRDPFWRAKVASEVKRHPALKEEIETTCGRCHVPMASEEAIFAGSSATLFEDGLLNPENPLFDAAMDGVSCTLCHQIEDSLLLGTDAGFSGAFSIAENIGIDRLLYGQYDNPLTGPMQNQVGFTPVKADHISASEMCATCHNLSTAVVTPQGVATGGTFPEQMVYTEWENSQFVALASCQDCHMPIANGDVRISTRPFNGLNPRSDFARHTFVGGNTYMLDILRLNAEQLGITATGFDNTIAQTRALLVSAVSLSLENITGVGGDLDFTLQLINNSGHKFPSGYPSRRAWLHITVSDVSGAVVFESGAMDAQGRIVDLESDFNPGGFEPHYETITRPDQVQSYETIMENVDGQLTYTLTEAAAYRKDNRLLPAGMQKDSVPPTIQARGSAYTDPNFVGGGDQVHFQIGGLGAGDYTIEARLNYQSLAYGFAQDLFTDIDDATVAVFKDLDEAAQLRFETVASDSGIISL